jgi:hypothetical protein
MTKLSSVQMNTRVEELFARRAAPLADLAEHAEDVARTCHAMAQRFHRGGKLVVFGNGGLSTDAQHVAVEFVRPVIVGKRALPAVSLTADIATVTVAASGLADHVLVAEATDPRVIKEVHVTMYHVLWELVHVFFEQPGVLDPGVVR